MQKLIDLLMPKPPSKDASPAPPSGLPESGLAAQALAQVLRPLARLMIGHGLQLMPMMELLKKALVEEAQASFGLSDKANSDTRVALLTGVHRKDVKRLRETPGVTSPGTQLMPVAAAVVGFLIGWFCVRLSSLYFGMLQISLGSLIWAIVFRWYSLTPTSPPGPSGIVLLARSQKVTQHCATSQEHFDY